MDLGVRYYQADMDWQTVLKMDAQKHESFEKPKQTCSQRDRAHSIVVPVARDILVEPNARIQSRRSVLVVYPIIFPQNHHRITIYMKPP